MRSRVMIHQPLISGTMYGPASDIQIQAEEMLRIRRELNQLLAVIVNYATGVAPGRSSAACGRTRASGRPNAASIAPRAVAISAAPRSRCLFG